MRKRAMRRALYGWIFFALPVGCIIGVLAFEAWINIEERRNDYEIAELKATAIRLNDALEKLRSKSAATQQLHKLHERALELGLREPEPWQIERVELVGPVRQSSEFSLARVIPDPPMIPARPVKTVAPAPEPVQPSPHLVMAEAPQTAPAPVAEEMAEEVVETHSPAAPAHVAQLNIAAAEPVRAQDKGRVPSSVQVSVPAAAFEEVHSTKPVLDIPSDEAEMLDESVESLLAI